MSRSGPAPAVSQNAAGPAALTLRIDVPPAASGSGALRRPHYISPAVTQMILDVKQGGVSVAGYPKTVALTPTSGGCTSTLANTQCALTVALSPGSYLVTLETLDAASNVLSTAQSIPVTVVAGVNNVVEVTLSGVPHAIVLLPKPSPLLAGDQTTGFRLVGPVAQSFFIEAIDAGGNIILGPGAPTFAVAQTGSLGLSLTLPSATAPNLLTVAPPAAFTASVGQLNVTASFPGATDACAQPGAVCTASVSVTMKELVAISNFGTSTIGVYEAGGAIPLVSVWSGVRSPIGLLFDKAGNLFVANSGGPTVTVYAPPYESPPAATMSTGARPLALALDASGDVFVANQSANTIQEFAPPYTGPAVVTIGSALGIATPSGLALDANGNLFVANITTVTVYAPPYTGLTATVTSGINFPVSIVVDPAANLIVANGGSNNATVYAAPYTGPPFTTISPLNSVSAVALDPSGFLFELDSTTGSVTESAPAPYTSGPSGATHPSFDAPATSLTLGPAGDLFVVDTNSVAEYQPPFPSNLQPLVVNSVGAPRAVAVAP